MCGRYTLYADIETIENVFEVSDIPSIEPRYNIAPSQNVPVVMISGKESGRTLRMMHWGLIPSWAKDINMGSKMINARAETVATKPAFRSAFKYRRCLIPANGFFEWKKQEGKKQPFYIKMRNNNVFAFAGLWETWPEKESGEQIESCTILTTEPNKLMEQVHDRMPVILSPGDYKLWIDPAVHQDEALNSLLKPYSDQDMVLYPVTGAVNNPKNNTSDCIKQSSTC